MIGDITQQEVADSYIADTFSELIHEKGSAGIHLGCRK